ncbi:hypothetical protein ACWC9H_08080 [Streptomyces sp. NPDC001251]|uniref:hypothetical protein n=1 Tax=Streptomyces hundungensis TaxID=1077946 RepID=UPI001DE76F59|nr:hypothetical protein [Streptomyces sp. MAG02]
MNGQADVGEERSGDFWVVFDAVDALFGGVSNIGEVVACKVASSRLLSENHNSPIGFNSQA